MENLSRIIDQGITNSKLGSCITAFTEEYADIIAGIENNTDMDQEQKKLAKNTYYILQAIRLAFLKDPGKKCIISCTDTFVRFNDSIIDGKCDTVLLKRLLEEDGLTCETYMDDLNIMRVYFQRENSEGILDRSKK